MTSISHTVYRNDDEAIEIEATGSFYRGELEDFSVEPRIVLTANESAEIERQLIETRADEYDESSEEG